MVRLKENMDAIVTAGGIPLPQDPLYLYTRGNLKASVDVEGKPMIQWVLDALGNAKHVDNVVIIGLSPDSGVTCKKPLFYVANQGHMLDNIIAGAEKALELNPKAEYVLIVSSDIPCLKPAMVDWLVETCMQTKDELYYGVVPRQVMETRWPGSRRTYVKFKDIQVCGADIGIVNVAMATKHLDIWEKLIGERKSPLKQAAMIGLGTFLLLLLGRLTLADAVERVTKRIGIKGRAIVWAHAEPGMDVDKPHQLELVRKDIAKQHRKTARKKVRAK